MSDLREELLRIASALIDENRELPEEEYDALVERWAALCPHPGGTDILFWPNELGLCRAEEIGSFEMSPQEMVEFALSWRPRTVAMLVAERVGGPTVGYYVYRLQAPDTPRTQVATALGSVYQQGAVVAVALKGMPLENGTRVETTYELGVASCGEILGLTDLPVGTVIHHGA